VKVSYSSPIVEMSVDEASLYRRHFFETYPGLKRWHDVERRAWQRGDAETRTLTGRRRIGVERLTDRLNAPVQGAGADGLKLALALLWERRDECPGAVPILVCHDEVVVECDADKAEEGKEWLVQAMKDGMDVVVNVMEPHIPIEVEVSVFKAWSG
jgi:DNA polymerase I